jgi:hypothetical protein
MQYSHLIIIPPSHHNMDESKIDDHHPPSKSSPINDTPLNRILTLAAIKLLNRHRPYTGRVLMISKRICIKFGPHTHLSEASAMRFIAAHTSIPVPKVLCAFTRHSWTYIVMERVDGDMIGRGWVNRSPESKMKILSQVKRMIDEMRRIPVVHANIANVDGGSLYDGRVAGTSLRFGPFHTAQEFHKHLRRGMEFHHNLHPEIKELIVQHEEPYLSLNFTHGDLSSLNILARKDEVVAIVDWETAGWYPSYWEYTTACQVNPQNPFWRAEIEKFLDPFPKELAMEKIRQRYFGDV